MFHHVAALLHEQLQQCVWILGTGYSSARKLLGKMAVTISVALTGILSAGFLVDASSVGQARLPRPCTLATFICPVYI